MKKWLVVLSILGIFMAQGISANEVASLQGQASKSPIGDEKIYNCKDSDRGINYNEKGNVTIRDDFADFWQGTTNYDRCTTDKPFNNDENFEENILFEVYCRGSDGEVKEELIYYEEIEIPEEKVAQGVEYLCPNGCYEGRCLSENEELKNPNIEFKPIKLGDNDYCNGCLKENTCYPYGYLTDGEYCGTLNKEFSCFEFSSPKINGEYICQKSLKYWWYKIFVRKYLHV